MTKQECLDVINNPSGKLICVDMDGTLCKGESWGHGYSEPYRDRIEFINDLYNKGAHIIIWSSRFPEMYQKTLSWLTKYGVRFHGIALQKKSGANLYIDDKCINVEDIDFSKYAIQK